MTTIGMYASLAAFHLIGDKYALFGKWLQHAGYEVVYLCWADATADMCERLGLAYVRATISRAPVDVPTEMAKFIDALPYKIDDHPLAPSLGEMLGYDDFPGSAMQWTVDGAGIFKPDLLVLPVASAENISPQDSYISMALSRFAYLHGIPTVQVEIATARSPLRLSHWPCTALLTKGDPRLYHDDTAYISSTKARMPLTHRYACSFGQEPQLDEICLSEPGLRKELGPPGEHFVFLPSHLAFKQRTIEMLARLVPLVPELRKSRLKLLIGCTQSVYRKRLTEAEMLKSGLRQWLEPWGADGWAIVEGVPHHTIAAIADAVLAPNESHTSEFTRRWGTDVLTPETAREIGNLAPSFPLADLITYILSQKEDGTKAEAP